MKICVDPGHGMSNASAGRFDPGATHVENGTEFREADVALRYGLTLKDVLRARQVPVFMTRDDNEDPAPVGRRARAAADAGCDAFISFHMNSVEDERAEGTETLYRDDADLDFATAIHQATVSVLGLRDRGLKKRTDLAVLRFDGRAVLLELGFIKNDRDRNRILEPQVRSSLCDAVADAALDHFTGQTGDRNGRRGGASERVAFAAVSLVADNVVEPKEHDWGGGDRSGYDIDLPLIRGDAALTQESFRAVFGDSGIRSDFNLPGFEALVRSWNLRHFAPAELLYLGASHYAEGPCKGLNRPPPTDKWARMERTAKMADEIRERFGHPLRIISGYRNSRYNDCVGGEGGSLHMNFNALDITNMGGTLRELYAIALDVRASEHQFTGGIGYYPGSRFIHIDTRGTKADW